MPKAVKAAPNDAKTEFVIFCPACKIGHMFRVPPWTFNGDIEKPTFGGSMLVRHTKLLPEAEVMIDRGESPPNGVYPHVDIVCHSFVTDGMIKFLDDCTHELKGKTVPLPDL
jgi:hypothetical protein